ncbi:MAG: invasion associated locus B family protein [Gammaproteobacteria bacterium]|nr:invasion associated locus B family protein [Gammaproteobacteria bacterium]
MTTDSYGDWQVICETRRGSEKSCVMRQNYLSATSGERLLEVNIAKTEDGTLMTMILPLGIYIPAGVVLQIDDFEPVRFQISFCTESGCFINEILEHGLLELMRKKISAKLTVEINQGVPVHPPLSISGFLDAYRSI